MLQRIQPAAAAGLQVGDRIVSLDGRLLQASDTLNREFLQVESSATKFRCKSFVTKS